MNKNKYTLNQRGITHILLICFIIVLAGLIGFVGSRVLNQSKAQTATSSVKLTPVSVTASTNDGNLPTNAIDNNLNTRWSAKEVGQTITLDYGIVKKIDYVSIAFYNGNQRTNTFDIQVSSDGANWTNVLSKSKSAVNSSAQIFDINDTAARYVRYVGYGNSLNTWNSITEIAAYGGSAEPVRPDADNTGVPQGTSLKKLSDKYNPATSGYTVSASGLVKFTKDNQTFEGVQIDGPIQIEAKNVTIRKSKIVAGRSNFAGIPPEASSWSQCRQIVSERGGNTPSYSIITATGGAVSNFVLEDSETVVNNKSQYINGFMGHDTTMRRVEISGVVDGVGVHNSNSTLANFNIEDSWIHDLYWAKYSPGNYNKNSAGVKVYCGYDSAHPEPTHNDGIQLHDGTGVNIVRNYINVKPTNYTQSNAGIMANGKGNLNIVGNYFQYGVCSVNLVSGLSLPINMKDNKFYGNNGVNADKGSTNSGCAIISPLNAGYNFVNNKWSNDSPVVVTKG